MAMAGRRQYLGLMLFMTAVVDSNLGKRVLMTDYFEIMFKLELQANQEGLAEMNYFLCWLGFVLG